MHADRGSVSRPLSGGGASVGSRYVVRFSESRQQVEEERLGCRRERCGRERQAAGARKSTRRRRRRRRERSAAKRGSVGDNASRDSGIERPIWAEWLAGRVHCMYRDTQRRVDISR